MKRLIGSIILAMGILGAAAANAADRPNVLLIITDDQGYGDLGVMGNPVIQTPHIDALARASSHIDPFYVSPVCAPTRASLMTGRYNYRTGVVDTYLGRAMMDTQEVTIAEILRDAGYRTGIFGKWHLGDNYPLRPMDQGFERSLVHKGGGIAQPSDPWYGSDYFDPVLYDDGKEVKTKGYCTDIYTDALIDFMEKSKNAPFFAYLATNTPHNPTLVADKYAAPYRNADLSHDQFPQMGQPLRPKFDKEALAKIFGMITNIDDNVGRALQSLEELGLTDNTIVIFMTDNGPQTDRYKVGLREWKGSVFEGGIRTPFFIKWPGNLKAGHKVQQPGAHIDVLPTLLDALNVEVPEGLPIDGRSLWPLLTEEKSALPDRTLYFQWHRGDAPELGRAFAARGPRYKLVQPVGRQANRPFDTANPMLFDLQDDPYEMTDLAEKIPRIVRKMMKEYQNWFEDVGASRGYAPVRIEVGTSHENPVVLTRQDWRGPRASWSKTGIGHWELTVADPGPYIVRIRFDAVEAPGEVTLRVKGIEEQISIDTDAAVAEFADLTLPTGSIRLEAIIRSADTDRGATHIEIETK